jgi:peptidoglycan/xylan/chitin deacetylase (PgdA/CDA1 family)
MNRPKYYFIKTIGVPLCIILLVIFGYLMKDSDPTQEVSSQEEVDSASRIESFDIPILVYHQIREYTSADTIVARQYIMTPTELEKQVAYLVDEGYTFLVFGDIPKILNGDMSLPEKSVLMSFDDGARNQYVNALPILRKYSARASFSIFTNSPQNSNYMSWNEISELAAEGYEIVSHTFLHEYLTELSSTHALQELTKSKIDLEDRLGEGSVQVVVYPFGLYDDRVISLASQAGYSMARTLNHGYTVQRDRLMELPGFIMTGNFEYFKKVITFNAN